ncbi:MAG: dicarboxylate/amino acid:cation symporter [Burkholderiales bacterium]|nr:dicarboxylate/amino acid:cation symporter [Burkholderiales bacterium]
MRKSAHGIGWYVFWSLIAGIIAGQLIHLGVHGVTALAVIVDSMNTIASLFMRLIKMIIAPLVFTTLVVGIARLSNPGSLGRMFLKAMVIFLIGGTIAIAVGYVVAEIFQPGLAMSKILNASVGGLTNTMKTVSHDINLKSFINELIPVAIVDSFAKNQIIQIVVFSIFMGIAGASLGKQVAPVFDLLDMLSKVIFRVTNYVMRFAPVAVFCSVTGMIAQNGLGLLSVYAYYLLEFYLALAILLGIMLGVGFIVLKSELFRLIKIVSDSLGIAFSTTSSEAVLPRILEELEEFGVHPEVAGFVLPLGYSFNLIGSMINCIFALMAIIQIYGYNFTTTQKFMMILILMVTSKGIAGVSRASLVIIATTLAAMGIGESAILVILPIASFCDMGYTTISVLANVLAAAFVDKWEKRNSQNA